MAGFHRTTCPQGSAVRLVGFTAMVVVAAAGLTVANAGPLAGQAPPDTVAPDTVYEIEDVVVRTDRRVGSTGGASGMVVLTDSLSLRPVSSIEEALRELPFILVRRNSRGMAEISVRGSESRQVAVLLDGVPLSIAWDHRTDPSVIPLLGVESLSIVRGLPSVLNGPNVLGGVVEVDVGRGARSARPESGVRAMAGWDDAGYESVGASGVLSRDVGLGSLVVRSGAGYRSREGVALPGGVSDPTGGGGLRTNSDVEELNGFGAVRWRGDLGSWVSLSGSGFRSQRGVPPELHVDDPRLWRIPNHWQVVTAFSAGTGQRDTPLGRGDLEASVGYVAGVQDIASYATPAYDEIEGTESGESSTLSVRLLGDHTLGPAGELRGAATYAEVDHLETIDGGAPTEYRQRLWSLASELAWRLPAATRVTFGAAFDGADTPETGGRPDQGTLSAWGGRVGASTLVLRQSVQLHGSLSSRARFPALRELYSGALGRFDPNPDLRPERLTAAEAGGTWGPPGGEVQATVFHHRLEDAVVRTTTAEGLFRRVNRHRINSTGLELLAGTRVGDARVQADLMLQDVAVDDPDAGGGPIRPEHMPELRAGLDLDAPLPLEIRGLVGIQHTGDQYCVHPDLGTDVELGASTRVDVGVRRSWRIGTGLWQAVRTTIAVDNAADAAAFDQCGMPQQGRTLRIGLEVF